jgi:hypothetical protein
LRSFAFPGDSGRVVERAVVELDRVRLVPGDSGGPSNLAVLLSRVGEAAWPPGGGTLVVRELELAVHAIEVPVPGGEPRVLAVSVRLPLRDVRGISEIVVPLTQALARAGVPPELLPQVPVVGSYVTAGGSAGVLAAVFPAGAGVALP